MRAVVVGGTGLIGRRLIALLRARGHDAVAAAPSVGVDIVSGEGLEAVLAGAHTVIDVSKPRTFDPAALEVYFTAAARNLTEAERGLGVQRHIALAAVGTSASSSIPFYRAKAAGEAIIRGAGVPSTLVRATQFFEFAPAIADHSERGGRVRLPDASAQPIAADDVAAGLADISTAEAPASTMELAGPEALPLSEFVRRVLVSRGDRREVIVDRFAPYFGGLIDDDELMPGESARIMPTRLDDWLTRSADNEKRIP